jgi:hypothetical protein
VILKFDQRRHYKIAHGYHWVNAGAYQPLTSRFWLSVVLHLPRRNGDDRRSNAARRTFEAHSRAEGLQAKQLAERESEGEDG